MKRKVGTRSWIVSSWIVRNEIGKNKVGKLELKLVNKIEFVKRLLKLKISNYDGRSIEVGKLLLKFNRSIEVGTFQL